MYFSMYFDNQTSNTFCVDQAPYDTEVQTQEIEEGVLIVAPYEHAHVCNENVLEAADDGGGKGGVVGSTEDGGVDKDKSKHA